MLELRRNQTEVGMIPDDSNIEKAIMPWEWYWHDPDRDLNFRLDTVKAWKDQVNLKSLSEHQAQAKEYEALYRSGQSEKRASVNDSKLEYMESLYSQG